MFGKKRCIHCNRKIEKKFDFCPFCGSQTERALNRRKDFGILGKSDDINELDNSIKHNFNQGIPSGLSGALGGSFFEKMLGGAFKMLENEMNNIDNEERKLLKKSNKNFNNFNPNQPIIPSNLQLFINGKRVPLQSIMQQRINPSQNTQKKTIQPKISEETLKKSTKLPRKEAKSKLHRTANKVVYELDTPGLNSLNNILINRLEDSIEVKVYTDKVVYHKTFPAKLPLIQYGIPEEGKLVLEFKA